MNLLSTVRYYLKRIRSITFREAVSTGRHIAVQMGVRLKLRFRDAYRSTFASEQVMDRGRLATYMNNLRLEEVKSASAQVIEIAKLYCEHRFDLLGSGWTKNEYGMKCRGIDGHRYRSGEPVSADPLGNWLETRINRANLKVSKGTWRCVDQNYVPIDWHIDFRSGFRWPENQWYLNIKYGLNPGADVKVPWELSRMQHLPFLAYAHVLSYEKDPKAPLKEEHGAAMIKTSPYAREFRNQLLDFMATNPPRYGVNWACTMDAAIRAVNWLITYDLFRSCSVEFDDAFERVFKGSLREHGRHIVDNLEFSGDFKANHYLADIVGLLFIAAYLPRSPETDVWLAFGVQELIDSVQSQFMPDGSNFEASTSYHRLSSEMVIYATAVVLGLPDSKRQALMEYDYRLHRVQPPLRPAAMKMYALEGGLETPFPPGYLEKIAKLTDFTRKATRPDGRIAQIGDNDSGRFLKLFPAFEKLTVKEARRRFSNLTTFDSMPDTATYWAEDNLHHGHLLAAAAGLFQDTRRDHTTATDTELVKCLANGITLPARLLRQSSRETGTSPGGGFGAILDEPVKPPNTGYCPSSIAKYYEMELPDSIGHEFIGKQDLRTGLSLSQSPDFGLYIFRSHRVFMAVRCGPNGQLGRGGHAHNDQLSFELAIDGVPVIVDPGTYCYTSLPEMRNKFRSTAMHNTMKLAGKEQDRWFRGARGLFHLGDESKAELVRFSEDVFEGRHRGFGAFHKRTLRVAPDRIEGTDEILQRGEKFLFFHFSPAVEAAFSERAGEIILFCGHFKLKLIGSPGVWDLSRDLYSPGYGVLEENTVASLLSSENGFTWAISIDRDD